MRFKTKLFESELITGKFTSVSVQSGPFVNRKTPRHCNLQSACAISADQPIDGWNFDRTRQPLFSIVDDCVEAARWLVGEQRGTFWRVPCCMTALAKANIWKAEYRVHCKHTLILAPTRSFFFAANDCKLAVEYVNIRQRKYARGIIFMLWK